MDTVFTLSNVLVLPFWLLMIALPHWRWTRRLMASPLVVVPAAVLYAALILPQLSAAMPALMNPQLAGIAALLGTDGGAAAAWAHFLAFDLFVGRWVYLDSRERGLSAWVMAPVLFLVLMLGPLGLLAYLGLRAVLPRRDAARPVAAS
jgi:hypothetical protein